MTAARLLLIVLGVVLGLGPGRRLGGPSAPSADAVRPVAERPGEPAHPAAGGRVSARGPTARPPSLGQLTDGRQPGLSSAPGPRYDLPPGRLAHVSARPSTRHGAPNRPPYFPTAPPDTPSAITHA